MSIQVQTRQASVSRVPAVEVGKAIVYERYGEEKAVAMNPGDFHRLAQLDTELEEIATSDHIPLDDFALEGLLDETRPQKQPIEDRAQIEALLGL